MVACSKTRAPEGQRIPSGDPVTELAIWLWKSCKNKVNRVTHPEALKFSQIVHPSLFVR